MNTPDEEAIPNIVNHIAELIAKWVDDTQSHRSRKIYQIVIAEDTIGQEVTSPHFSLDQAGSVLEYPLGLRSAKSIEWCSVRRDHHGQIMPQTVWPPDGSRIHHSIQAFADSVFSRISAHWNDLIDRDVDAEDDYDLGGATTRTLSCECRSMTLLPDGCCAVAIFESHVLMSANRTSQEHDAIVKAHFIKVLEDLRKAIWAQPKVIQ